MQKNTSTKIITSFNYIELQTHQICQQIFHITPYARWWFQILSVITYVKIHKKFFYERYWSCAKIIRTKTFLRLLIKPISGTKACRRETFKLSAIKNSIYRAIDFI